MSPSERQLGATLKAALKIWDAMKADGASLAERVSGLAQTLRAAWPFTREWKYLCQSCDDYGLVIRQCPGDATCGRPHPHLPHSWGDPCWCEAGKKWRPKGKPTDEDAVTKAATTRKPTRWGR